MATWRALLDEALKDNGEDWGDIESSTLTPEAMTVEFDNGYGGYNGVPFTVWTTARVYFPVGYDGSESVGSVSRHPDGKKTPHIGGGV